MNGGRNERRIHTGAGPSHQAPVLGWAGPWEPLQARIPPGAVQEMRGRAELGTLGCWGSRRSPSEGLVRAGAVPALISAQPRSSTCGQEPQALSPNPGAFAIKGELLFLFFLGCIAGSKKQLLLSITFQVAALSVSAAR